MTYSHQVGSWLVGIFFASNDDDDVYQEESVKDGEASEDVDEARFQVHLLLLREHEEANYISWTKTS